MSKKRSNPDQMPWFKCYQDLWLDGTRDLTPEQRGIYFDCLCLIYKYDQPLRDDADWVAHKLHVKPRVWKRVRDELISCGKLVQTSDGLINGRAEKEIVEHELVKEKRSKSAGIRQEKFRNEPRFPFENNKRGGTDGPQRGLHARAQSDHQKEEEVKKEGSEPKASPAIDLDLVRIDPSLAARSLIAGLCGPDAIEGILADARQAALNTGKKIVFQDVYCVAMAIRKKDSSVDMKAANRRAKRLLNGDEDQGETSRHPAKHKPTPQEISRMSAPTSSRSALLETGLLKGSRRP